MGPFQNMAVLLRDHLVHWRKKIEKSMDDDVILNVIRKLSKIPISIELLKETLIERCIKKLTKRQDGVGKKSLALLQKWQLDILKLERSRLKKSSHNTKSKKENISKERDVSKQCNILSKSETTNTVSAEGEKKQSDIINEHKYKGKGCLSSENYVKLSSKHINNDYHLKKSDQFSPSLYSYKKGESCTVSFKALDYDPDNDINEGYNPECPELYPGTKVKFSVIKKDCLDKTSTVKTKSNAEEKTKAKIKNKKQRTESHSYTETEICSERKEKPNATLTNKKTYSKDTKNNSCLNSKHKKKSEIKISKSVSSRKKISGSAIKKSKIKINSSEEFTSSEVRFEDCLGFNDFVIKKKSVKNQGISGSKKSSGSSKKNNKGVSTSCKKVNENEASNKDKMTLDVPKSIVKIDEVDIDSTLPDIQPNYRPLPQRYLEPLPSKKKILSNEEAIKFTSSRKEKTAVYSGRRNIVTGVPSLYEICTRILIEHIDAIEHMGGVPYFLVKPVLDKCSPAQLDNIENFNPYLLEDTHELWEIHCKRDYKLLVPGENETWRELYMRASEEREKKLRCITANISASMSKSNPVRQVKLAYVDSVAKPPRDVARKQAKHGTSLPVSHLKKAVPPPKASPKPTAPFINLTASSAQSTTVISKKPKVAPLMAKTLKSMKMCFRRK